MRRHAAWFLVALAALFAGSRGSAAEDLGKLVADLGSEDSTVRIAAYTALNRTNDPAAVPLLVEALPSMPQTGQYYGVLVINRFPPKVGRPALRKLVGSSSRHLRVTAAATLQRAGETDVVRVIVKALEAQDVEPAERATLLTRIYSVRDENVQAAVRKLIDASQDLQVIEAAVWNVYFLRDQRAVPALRRVLASVEGVQTLTAACLLLLGEVAHVDVLAKALREEAFMTSHIYKVKTFLGQSRPVPPSVLEAVLARLEEEESVYVVRTLIEILGEHGYAKAVPALRKRLDHRDALVSKAAFEALSSLPGALSLDRLRQMLSEGEDARRLAVADALRRADDPSGLDVVLEILVKGARVQDRWDAAKILGGFRTARVVDPLIAALLDDHTSVRAHALTSLRNVLHSLFPYRRLDLASTGYATTASAAVCKAAVAKIRTWWQAHRKSGW